jgi:hypothetical protein
MVEVRKIAVLGATGRINVQKTRSRALIGFQGGKDEV